MANKSALRASAKADKADKEDREYRKRVKYRLLKPGWDQKNNKSVPRNFTVLSVHDRMALLTAHKVKGTKGLKVPALCPTIHDPDHRGDCEYCESEGDYGPNNGRPFKVAIVYCHDFEGEIFRKDGKEYPISPLRVIMLNQGKDSGIWEVIDDAIEEGVLNKCVFQMVNTTDAEGKSRGMKLKRLSKDKKLALSNSGKVPAEARAEIVDLTFDEHLAHLLNIFRVVNWEYWDVEQPQIKKEEDAEGEEDESYADEDEDDDKAKKGSSKTKKKRSRGRIASKPSEDEDEDEDEDDEEDSDDDDDEEETRPKKSKSKSRTSSKPSKSKKKPVKEDDDEEDDEDEDDSLTDPDDDDEDEEEDEKPVKKAKKKSKR